MSALTLLPFCSFLVHFRKNSILNLKAKEDFLSNKIVSVPREIDFLALYLTTELKFDFVPDSVMLDDGMWEEYIESEEYKYWQKEIPQS